MAADISAPAKYDQGKSEFNENPVSELPDEEIIKLLIIF